MTCITAITEAYRRKEIDLTEVIGRLFQCEEARKIAYSLYLSYKKNLSDYEWEDVLTSGIYRYAHELRREEDGPKGYFIKKPEGLFWTICNQVCFNLKRGKDLSSDGIFETFYRLIAMGNPGLYDLLVRLLGIFGFPCGRLLFLYYLEEPPVKDYQKLFEMLQAEAEKMGEKLRLRSAKGIPTLLWTCRGRFRDFLKGREELEDLF